MKKTVKSLWLSALSILLCFAMLAGSTFAWFTDSVESAGNKIVAGNLDIEMYWTKDLNGTWINAEDQNAEPVFNYDKWEPGYTEVRYVKIVNAGSLAFKYALSIIAEGEVGILADVIDVYFVEAPNTNIPGREALKNMTPEGTLTEAIMGQIPANGVLLAADQTKAGFYSGEIVVAIALKMREEAGNKYMGESVGDGFYLRLDATQYDFENDAFGGDYDSNVQIPGPIVDSEGTVAVTPVNGMVPAGGVAIDAGNGITANVPEGVKMKSGAKSLTLSVANMNETNANLFMGASEKQTSLNVHIDGVAPDNTVPMEVTVANAAAKGLNSTSLKLYHVENGATVQMTLVGLSDAFTAHNQFKYDPATGNVTIYIATFSEFAMTTNTENKWEGGFDYSWYDASKTELYIANADQLAAFGAIVGGMYKVTGRENKEYSYSNEIIQDSFKGKTVYLSSDIYIGDITDEDGRNLVFYPIGYYNNTGKYEKKSGNVGGESGTEAIASGFYSFEGTFDGQGHVVSSWYHNTWESFGDYNDGYSGTPNHNRDGFGLFGRVYGATIKNLVIDNFKSDGEFTTTGCVAAYADFGATFENISIFNSNPRVYNIGNGGVVGCVGWYTKGETDVPVTFKNITVDRSNKITALWGSWDVACGGIVGQYYPTSGQTVDGQKPKNAGITMIDCHVSAQIDVYNDVCANYQYYAYRYSGILMGSVRENETINGHEYPKMNGITFQNCTVNFGDWNDYYYCELVANSLASYTHDHQMSRLEQVAAVNVENKTYTPLNSNTPIAITGTKNFVVVKAKDANNNWIHGDGHNFAECYHFVNGEVWNHEQAGTETVNGETVLKEDKQCIYRQFNNLVTGYGWGVTSKGYQDYPGSVTLDNVNNSEEKFTGTGITSEENGFPIRLSELFSAKATPAPAKAIKNNTVYVTVTNVDANNNYITNGGVKYEYAPNYNDWTKSTITFSGTGRVAITIQDYYFCTPTTIYVDVTEAKMNVLLKGEDLLNTVTTGKSIDNTKLAINVDTNKTELTDGYVHVVAANSSGSATSYNLETYFYILTGNGADKGNQRIETGKYFVMKYRVPEKIDPYSNFTGFQIYTDSGNEKYAVGEDAFNYNVIDTDGEWHILVIDLSKNDTAKEHYIPDENDRYYGNFVRVDIFANVPTGQAMDIEFVGMASSMAEIENAVNDIQAPNNYNSDNKVGHYAYIENSATPTLLPMTNHSNLVDSSVFIPEDKIATGIEYVACVDFANIYTTGGSIYEDVKGGYTTSSTAINTISFNNRSAYLLYVNGWAVVDGGVKNYAWSADGGNTWHALSTTGGEANSAMITNANSYHYGDYTFAGTYEHASFQADARLNINFAGTGYTGTKDIIVAAVPNKADSKYLIVTVIKDVNVVSNTGIFNCDADSFVDSTLYTLSSKTYSMNVTLKNGANGTVISNETAINPATTKRIIRVVYDHSNFGDIDYLNNNKAISSVKLDISKANVDGGFAKYVWSYDGTVWYDVENGMIDFAKLIADKPWLSNRMINVTIAAIPNKDAIPADGKIELCVVMRLLDFRIALKADQQCVGEYHPLMAPEYAIGADGYVTKIITCACGAKKEVDETFVNPNYAIHFDTIGANATASANSTRFSNVKNNGLLDAVELDSSGYITADGTSSYSFTTDPNGKLYVYGWAGIDNGFNDIVYRVVYNANDITNYTSWTSLNPTGVKEDSDGIATTLKNKYNIDYNGQRFGTQSAISIDLSNFLKTTSDRVTIELAFVYTDAMLTLGNDALVFAGRFTNVKLGCSSNNHKMYEDNVKYLVDSDGYIVKINSACVCGNTYIVDENFKPGIAMHFDSLGSLTSDAGTDLHNVDRIDTTANATTKYDASGYTPSTSTTPKSFTTHDADGDMTYGDMRIAGWIGIEGGLTKIKYRVKYLDENGAEKTSEWIGYNCTPRTSAVTDALKNRFGITCEGKGFDTTIKLGEYFENGQNSDGVTVEFAIVYPDALANTNNENASLIKVGSFTNVKLPAVTSAPEETPAN